MILDFFFNQEFWTQKIFDQFFYHPIFFSNKFLRTKIFPPKNDTFGLKKYLVGRENFPGLKHFHGKKVFLNPNFFGDP